MLLSATRRDVTPRRGMLLLLVLSILALFVVIGGVGILLALRARETARAFAAATASQAGSSALARAQLDEALLRLIRGANPASGPPLSESLLEDKYGAPQSCQVTALTGITSAYLTATIAGLDLSNPCTVAGRVLTLVPAANDPTGPTSYRILRSNAAAGTVLLANVKPNVPLALPTGPCEAVINGREFSDTGGNEPYDAFDAQNPFLTVPGIDVVVPSSGPRLVSGTLFTPSFTVSGVNLTTGTYSLWPLLYGSAIAKVQKPAFGTPDTTCTVDNDGDGVPDGIWLDGVLPSQRTPDGGQLSFSVSYLVLDLDGRINLNAHGSFVRAQLPQTTGQYPKDLNAVPVGMGFGPADVDAARLVASQAELNSTSGAVPARWALLLQGGPVTRNALVSSTTQWRPTPLVETTQQGRYTQGTSFSTSAPGNSGLTTGTSPANADYWMLNPVGNSPTDLKARLQVYTVMTGGTPSLQFCRPQGAPAWVTSGTDDVVGTGANMHPYALRLDEDAPRAAGSNAVDALFTVGELERLLRPFDSDAATLAPRLAAILDDFAEQSRMTVTTDSWDTPAITGTAVTRTGTAVTGGNPYDVLSPETVAGLRFNLNAPVGSGTTPAAQAYFRQLYTLTVALGVPADDAAQWAANVIEFRDPDSIMTWYPYDPNPLDGVWETGTGVWGAERPEMVITKVVPSASGSSADVTLQRPNWKAELVAGSGSTVSGTTERIDGILGDRAANTLDATKVVSGSAVWMLSGSMTSGTGLNALAPSATAVGPNAAVGTVTVTTTSGTVFLLRLADPSRGVVASNGPDRNDYVPVHTGSISSPDTLSRWLHWPNRDFVSHGELMVVPSGRPVDVPKGLFDERGEAFLALTGTLAVTGTSGTSTAGPLLLEATIVPSRFAAANVSVANGPTYLAGTGYESFQYGQFSRWREAGRVNVNTILPNIGNIPPTLDDAVWIAVLGLSGTSNPVALSVIEKSTRQTFSTYSPITSGSNLLLNAGEARFVRSEPDAASAFLKRATAIRLANCATTRSQVFAVWITLRITDSSPNAGPPQFARLFAIVDRSIPVGYAPGRNLNVRETIRLQRFLP